MLAKIEYKSGYKYQLTRDYAYATDIFTNRDIDTDYISLTKSGFLTVKKGYAWDGPSGPTIDTSNFMRGSLLHDACYQLMRERLINQSNRDKADKLLYECVRADGMSWVRAQVVYWAVRWFGGPSADPALDHPAKMAP